MGMGRASGRAKCSQPPPQGPGPPHRPHIPAGADEADDAIDDFPADSAPTANMLNARAVCAEPHDGHFTVVWELVWELIVRCNCSNFASHALQVYS
jgi:hypothetical protein